MLQPPANCPPAIPTNIKDAFAHNTMLNRVPDTIRQIQERNTDYSQLIQDNLNQLHDEIKDNNLIRMLQLDAPDYDSWKHAHTAYKQHTWLDTEWFFAETYFYRRVIEAVRWWETGRDPFTPWKQAEYAEKRLWDLVDTTSALRLSIDERLMELLGLVLWGNRIDLSFTASLSRGMESSQDDLLVDDRAAMVEHIMKSSGAVHLIADNAGTELAMDCVLLDALLDGICEQVFLHVKVHPTFVSDATPADVHQFIEKLRSGNHGTGAKGLGDRLRSAFDHGYLRILPHPFWNSSHFLWDMPQQLIDAFADARLVLIKGDANYRRMVGDAFWVAQTPFSDVLRYFPAPIAALRTLKSNPIIGLKTGQAEELDAIDREWRVNGKRGLIQFSGK